MTERKIDTSIKRVYLSALDSYDTKAVSEVVVPLIKEQLKDNKIEEAGLLGKTVVIKPNLLAKREAEAGITTHPSFVSACAEYFISLGTKVVVADSPGGVYNKSALDGIYKVTGMEAACLQTGAELNYDFGHSCVFKGEISRNSFNIINPLINADLIVNLSRLKTHALCEMSAAVKNMFGSIPGLQKAEQHARFPKKAAFADMLCDLCLINAPVINITDGVVGMEGNGPAGGTLKKVGAVIASANPFASDLVCAYIMGYKPKEVGTVECAIKRGLCPESVGELEIVGNAPLEFASNFKRPDASAGGLVKQLPSLFGGALRPKPKVRKSLCIGCGECMRNCPVSTIKIQNKKAKINPDACIKCYCCQEFCPVKAISVKRFFAFKL